MKDEEILSNFHEKHTFLILGSYLSRMTLYCDKLRTLNNMLRVHAKN